MNRNDLLAATRDQFLQSFSKHASAIVEASLNSIYAKAEATRSSNEERRLLNMRTELTSRRVEVEKGLSRHLEKLLNRSFQTAYNNMQQSGIKGIKRDAFSLIDTSAVELDLRLDRMTKSFRDVAGNELRDLNIRIALLFLQDSIKERENPFRPYLLARGLRDASETIELPQEDYDVLADEFADALRPEVNGIYAGLNELMSKHGIGTELKLTIRKSAAAAPKPGMQPYDMHSTYPSSDHHDPNAAYPHPYGAAHGMPQPNVIPNASGAFVSYHPAAYNPASSQQMSSVTAGGAMMPGMSAPPMPSQAPAGTAPVASRMAGQQAATVRATRQVIEQHAREEVSRQRVERFINWVRKPDDPLPTVLAPNIDEVFAQHLAEVGNAAFANLAASRHGHLPGTAGELYQPSADGAPQVQAGPGQPLVGMPGMPAPDLTQVPGYLPGDAIGVPHLYPAQTNVARTQPIPAGSASLPQYMQVEAPEPFVDPLPNGQEYGVPHTPYTPTSVASPAERGQSAAAGRTWMKRVQAIGSTFRRLFDSGPVEALAPPKFAFSFDADDEASATVSASDSGAYSGMGHVRGSALGRPRLPSVPQRVVSEGLLRSVGHISAAAPTVEQLTVVASDGEASSIRNLIMEHREALTAATEDEAEQMSIDVVAMLFEFILRDVEVPSETRAQLGRLQFVVLKVALRDVEFFTHPSHPARMFVNRVGSLAHSLKQVDPDGQRLNDEVCRIVEVILADPHAEAQLFSDMVDELDHFVAGQLRSTREEIELAVRAMESIESRTLKFARVTSAIADGLSGLKVDVNLHRLLVDTWANVVEIIECDFPEKALRFRQLVPDLVWSVAPKVEKTDRNLLIAMLPGMLGTLREGMTLLNWDQTRQDEELAWLVENHTFALRSVPVNAQVPPLAMIREQFAAFVEPGAVVQGEAQLDGARRMNALLVQHAARQFGAHIEVIDHMLSADPELGSQADTGLEEPAQEAASDENKADVLARLRAGVRVMLVLVGEPSPARLTWVSPTATTMMLSFDDDDKSFMVTVRMFIRLLSSGRATFIETEPLFERAVRQLLESAENMDRANSDSSPEAAPSAEALPA